MSYYVNHVLILAEVMVRCQECRCDGFLCSRWHLRLVSYPALEDFFWLLDPNVSCSPPSFDLKSLAFVVDVMVDVEKLVQARSSQRGGPLVFSFPFDPFVSLFEAVHCIFSVFFVHRVPHVRRFLRVLYVLFVHRVPQQTPSSGGHRCA